MAESLSLLSRIFFAASSGLATLAVVFFIVFKIPDVVGGLSGRKLRRSIQKQREANEKGGRSCRPSRANETCDRQADKIRTQPLSLKKETEYIRTGILPEGREVFSDATALSHEAVAMEMVEEIMFIHTDEFAE